MFAFDKNKISFIFGYRVITIDKEKKSAFLSSALRSGINLATYQEDKFKISERDFKKINASGVLPSGCKVSPPQGLYGIISANSKRFGLVSAFITALFLIFLSANTVFDVRINGCEDVKKGEILEKLDASGLSVGTFWIGFDKTKAESSFLDLCEEISWVNINRRGSVAYVDVIEKKPVEDNLVYDYCNVVATSDCVIEDITVKNGYAVVKKGDTVKRGDVLISGAPPGGAGGFRKAEGVVIGRVNEVVEVSRSYEFEEKVVLCENKRSLLIKIFNFSINIFNFTGNSVGKYDIIEKKTDLTLFGKKVPINIIKSYEVEYSLERKRYSDNELISIVSDEMSFLVSEIGADAELLKMKSHGEFSDNGYTLETDLILLRNIGECVPFEID